MLDLFIIVILGADAASKDETRACHSRTANQIGAPIRDSALGGRKTRLSCLADFSQRSYHRSATHESNGRTEKAAADTLYSGHRVSSYRLSPVR